MKGVCPILSALRHVDREGCRTRKGIPRRQMGRELSAYNFGEISLRNPRGAERSETGKRGKGLEWMEA